ncbi:MFS transporter [Vibrio sp. OCN044]|uniref:MFS transporter n=1 Tax=Vibrio tetraodonis subsp. pristinus TaxID=2695891 RepID=A0A6L8M0M6_9VIBR|nr:MFS transporter [Vibrio tetraodonis]MYM59099.1 MFS transporter [Vibrio tetraodonis subsp. pristinus]
MSKESHISEDTPSKYRWFILGVGVVAQVVFAAGFTGVAVSGVVFKNEFDFSMSQLGMILGAIGLGVGLSEFVWGLVTDKYGDKKVLIFGLFSMGVTYSFTALFLVFESPNYLFLTLLLFLAGILGGSINSSSGKTIMSWFSDGERGFAMSIRQTAIPVGGSIGTVLIPWLAQNNGFSASFILLAILSVLTSLIIWLFVVEKKPSNQVDIGCIERSPIGNYKVWGMVISAGLLTVPQMAVISFGAIYLKNHLNVSLLNVSMFLIIVQVLGASLRVYFGKSTDRKNNRIGVVIAIAFICAIMSLSLALFTSYKLLSIALLIAVGILGSAWHGIGFTEAAIQAGGHRAGTALGMMGTAVFLSSFLTPVIISNILQLHNWSIVWGAVSLLTILTIPVLFCISSRHARSEQRV